MGASIDFLAQDLLGTFYGQCGHLLTQGFTGGNGLLLSFGAGSGNNFVAFLCRTCFGFFNDGMGRAAPPEADARRISRTSRNSVSAAGSACRERPSRAARQTPQRTQKGANR